VCSSSMPNIQSIRHIEEDVPEPAVEEHVRDKLPGPEIGPQRPELQILPEYHKYRNILECEGGRNNPKKSHISPLMIRSALITGGKNENPPKKPGR